MKIKKLELHNIASIENATIDFEKGPLSEADLFLITGTTGAGKTTILDGISLALYNTTPRINKGKNRVEGANEDNLASDNPRHLVRQNTAYAFVKLHFEGNDGVDYCAEWSVQRGKKRKLGTAMSNQVWTVTNLKTGEQTTGDKESAYKEVGEVIKKAVGLDFNQFCRTTMLAQGEFTEFLKSDENDKAAILEKISGSEIYRKIGMEIHRQTEAAKKRYETEEEKRQNIIVLDPEKRKEMETEKSEIEQTLADSDPKIKDLSVRIQWLTDEAAAQKRVNVAETELQTAETVVNTEEFAVKENEVAQWKTTIDVRQKRKGFLSAKNSKDKAKNELSLLEASFRDAVGGEAHLIGYQSYLSSQLDMRKNEIQSQEANTSAYANNQTIIANINSHSSALTELKEKTDARKRCVETELPEAKTKEAEAAKAHDAAKEELLKANQDLDAISRRLEELNLGGLRNEKDFLKDIETIKNDIENHQNSVSSQKKAIRQNEEVLETYEAKAEQESAELKRLALEHQRRSETINEFSKLMRSKLNEHLGETENLCPVCGQHVSSLKADAVLDSEYAKIKKEFEDQTEKAKNAEADVANTKNLIDVIKGQLENSSKLLKAANEKLSEKVIDRADSQTLLEASNDDITAKIVVLTGKITEGEAIEQTKTEATKLYNEKVKAESDAKANLATASNTVKNAEQRIKDLNEDIRRKTEAINSFSSDIAKSLEGTMEWENDWKSSPKAFIEELKDKATAYNSSANQVTALEKQIEANTPVLTSVKKMREEVVQMVGWRIDGIAPAEKKDLQNAWIHIRSKVETLTDTISKSMKEMEEYDNAISSFLDEHKEYSVEQLDKLDRITSEANANNEQYVNNKRNAVTTAKSQCDKAKEEYNALLETKPENLGNEDTAESLISAKKTLEDSRDKLNIRKGALETELRNDDEMQQKKDDTTLLDQLRSEMEKWKRFNSLYGDATGKKLCTISQSYVLESLLSAANHHLQSMAPRYRLLVNPGTLNMKLEDKYNGFATRHTNTISGGESFLVSLSLALALADFGQHLGVSTLFIDEGFGTLSGEALQTAINTLKSLHSSSGRQVGIISHREEIRESIPVKIKVSATAGSSASTVEVLG